jgi:peptidyl-prolyl cis-trans isomerase D
MMKTLRKVFVFVLFGGLIVAFAVSMGGNNSFERYTHPTVAKVGSVEITPPQYQRAYQRSLENFSIRAGRPLTAQQAKRLGLPQRVLAGLIQDSAVDLDAKNLGLGLSEAGLRKAIMETEAFQEGGKFDPEKYQKFLQRVGYSAVGFENDFKSDLIRRQVQNIFRSSGVVPAPLLNAYNAFRNEERTLAYFTLGPDAAGTIEEPSSDALQAFFDERKTQFMAPELRKTAVLAVTPQVVAKRVSVSEEQLKAEYDAKAASYNVPERRKVEIIPFQSQEAAEKAAAAIASGTSFSEAAKQAGFKEKDIAAGTVSKKELGEKFAANEAILDAVFTLKKDAVTKPLNGPLSWVVARVLEIVPPQEKSFNEVKDRIRDDLVKAQITAETAKLTKEFEEERASGLQLQDSAKKLDLPLEEAALDQRGNGEDGKPVSLAAVPAPALAGAAFKSAVGVENEALRLPGNGYAWFEVTAIVPARQKPFDEVKAEVLEAWRKDQIRIRLGAKARELVEQLSKGTPVADAAKSVGAEVKTSKPLKRDGSEEGLPQQAVAQAFTLAEGGASSAASDAAARVVFQAAKIAPPAPLDEARAKTLEQELSAQIAEDNFAAYLLGVEKAAGVTIDQKTLAAAEGGSYDSSDGE